MVDSQVWLFLVCRVILQLLKNHHSLNLCVEPQGLCLTGCSEAGGAGLRDETLGRRAPQSHGRPAANHEGWLRRAIWSESSMMVRLSFSLCGFRFLDVWFLLREGALGFVLKVEDVG